MDLDDYNVSSATSSQKLGVLFACMGLGCLVGPLMAEPFVTMERPTTLQLGCITGYGFIALGYFGWEFWDPLKFPFWHLGITAGLRSMGASIIWTHSSLLLQQFSVPNKLGRVMSVDYALALLLEAVSAALCGVLIDKVGMPLDQICLLMGLLSTFILVLWWQYHCAGCGAVAYQPTTARKEQNEDDEDNPERYTSTSENTESSRSTSPTETTLLLP